MKKLLLSLLVAFGLAASPADAVVVSSCKFAAPAANQFLIWNNSTSDCDITPVSGFFKIDQTTPQTVINGLPIFDQGIATNDGASILFGTSGVSASAVKFINSTGAEFDMVQYDGSSNLTNALNWNVGGENEYASINGGTSNRHVFYVGNGSGTPVMIVDYTGFMGIGNVVSWGAIHPAVPLDIIDHAAEIRLRYDTTHYASQKTDSVGNATFDLTGTTPTFAFNKAVTITSTLDASSNSQTLSLVPPKGNTTFGIRMTGSYTDGITFEGTAETNDASISNFFAVQDFTLFSPVASGKSYWSYAATPVIAGAQNASTLQGIIGGIQSRSSGSTYSGTLTNGWAVDSTPSFKSGTVTNLAMYHGTVAGTGATVTNFYGMLLPDITLGTTINRAIKTGAGQVEFGDHLIWTTDNTKDIGASGATRPRTGYFGTSVNTPAISNLTSNGFVKTGSGNGTLSVDTTSYQPAGTYVTNVTGTSPIASSGGTTPAISIANAAADGSTKGAAAFNSTNFSASSGVVNTIQDIATSSSPSFSKMTSTVATGTAPFTVTSTTQVTNLNASQLQGKVTGTSGGTIPLLNGANTWSGTNNHSDKVSLDQTSDGSGIFLNIGPKPYNCTSTFYYALYNYNYVNNSGSGGISNIYSSVDIAGSGTQSGNVYGLNGVVQNLQSTPVTGTAFGMNYIIVQAGSGTVTNMTGARVDGRMTTAGGNITTYDSYNSTYNLAFGGSSSGNITTLTHYRVTAPTRASGSNVITTQYGLYVPDLTGAFVTNAYGAWFDVAMGTHYRDAATKIYSSATNTLDLDTTTTLNRRIGGTVVVATTAGTESVTGNLKLTTAGNGVYVKEGSNATMGRCTLVLGTCTVSTTKVTTSSEIFLSVQSLGTVAVATPIAVTARTGATSFVITSSSATDTSVIAWMIVEPSP